MPAEVLTAGGPEGSGTAPVHIDDASTVAAFDAIETTYAQRGKNARIIGLNEASTAWHGRLSGKLGAGH